MIGSTDLIFRGRGASAPRGTVVMLTTVALLALGRVDAAEVRIVSFDVKPTSVAVGEPFEIAARVRARDVKTVSCVFRTTTPIDKDKAPPCLSHYNARRQLAYLPGDVDVHLTDNGARDRNPDKLGFRFRIDTTGWRDGAYELSFFAHNRPGPGRHTPDERLLFAEVASGRVKIHDLGEAPPTRLDVCKLEPPTVSAGQGAALIVDTTTRAVRGISVRTPYRARRKDVPPGFAFDGKDRFGYLADPGKQSLADNGPLDADPARGRIQVRLDTAGWRPGLYHLEVRPVGSAAGRHDTRNLALKVRSPYDHLAVSVSSPWLMGPGTHAERLARFKDGTLVHGSGFSTDDGQTWRKRPTGTIGVGPIQLRSGQILSMGYRTRPIEGRDGWYQGQRYASGDNGRTVTESKALFHVPQAKPAHGHAYHPGPLYMRSMVERPDGSLVALMAGWFKGDDEPCPHNVRRPYSRTYTCESTDGGKTWSYLTTIGYDYLGSEGYNEGVMAALPDGRLIAMLRTGSMKDPRCQDNPIMQTYSCDGGRTWSEPVRSSATGAFPDLVVLSDGTLAASYGRPGACILFSADLGKTWTDHTVVDTTPYSGYTSVCELAPGKILMAFGTKDYREPETGKRSNGIRLATVTYKRRGTPKPRPADHKQRVMQRLDGAGATLEPLQEGFVAVTAPSRALGRDEQFVMRLPDDYRDDRAHPYPLIVLLHGAGRSCRTLVEDDRTRAMLAGSPAVVVMPNGRGSWWVNSPVDPTSRYDAYLVELIRTVERHVHVTEEPVHRAIGGWSMGGFGSANVLARHPKLFGSWAGIVGLLDFPNPDYPREHNHTVPDVLGKDQGVWQRYNPCRRAEAFKGKRILLITAGSAFDRQMNQAFAARLKELGIEHTLKVLDGGHTFDVVARALPEVLAFFHESFEDAACPAGEKTHR